GGGYGYPMLTEIAAKIQFQLANNCYEEAIELVKELDKMCKQIVAGLSSTKQQVNDQSSVA
ncbi:MAG: BPS1 family protein, partial [Gammaproteobacteria bacterium]|nr:BPS1 family protein [Gammaproteobacteria bacterium]